MGHAFGILMPHVGALQSLRSLRRRLPRALGSEYAAPSLESSSTRAAREHSRRGPFGPRQLGRRHRIRFLLGNFFRGHLRRPRLLHRHSRRGPPSVCIASALQSCSAMALLRHRIPHSVAAFRRFCSTSDNSDGSLFWFGRKHLGIFPASHKFQVFLNRPQQKWHLTSH
mgnify:CR=1 FL=1